MNIKSYFRLFCLTILLLNISYLIFGQQNTKIVNILEEVQKAKIEIFSPEKFDSISYNSFDFNSFLGMKKKKHTHERYTVFSKDSIIKLIRFQKNNKVIDFEVIAKTANYTTYNAFVYSNFTKKTGAYINGYFVRNKKAKTNYLFLFRYSLNSVLKTNSDSYSSTVTSKSDILIDRSISGLTQERLIIIFELDNKLKPLRRLNIFYNQLISTSQIIYEEKGTKELLTICGKDYYSYKGADIYNFDFDEIDQLFMEPSLLYYPCFHATVTREIKKNQNIDDLWMSNNMWYK